MLQIVTGLNNVKSRVMLDNMIKIAAENLFGRYFMLI